MEYCSEGHLITLAFKFEEFRSNGQFCDFELTCGGPVLKVHHLVLAAASPVFEATLKAGCRGLHLDFLEPDLLTLLVDFMYTGKISVSSTKVQELMCAANFLELKDLVTACADYLTSQLQGSNALSIFRSAKECHQPVLMKKARRCYWEYQRSKFLELPLEVFLELLKSPEFKGNQSEDLQMRLQWLRHRPERAHFTANVFDRINLTRLLSLGPELNNIQDLRIAQYVSRLITLWDPTLVNRQLYVVGGRLNSPDPVQVTATVLKYDMRTRSWSEVASMSTPRCSHGVAVLGGEIYAVGGEGGADGDTTLASAEVYDPATDEWAPLPPMREARSHFGLVALEGRLYAFGGECDGRLKSTIEKYDSRTREWTVVGKMPEPRSQMGVVAYKNAIYAVGGVTGAAWRRARSADLLHCRVDFVSLTRPPARVRRFSRARRPPVALRPGSALAPAPVDRSVYTSRMAPMRRARSGLAAVLEPWRGCLYALGGVDEDGILRSVERYNFATNEWEDSEDMLDPRCSSSADASPEALVVVGGDLHWPHGSTANVELYDLFERRWLRQHPMPQPRAGAGAASV